MLRVPVAKRLDVQPGNDEAFSCEETTTGIRKTELVTSILDEHVQQLLRLRYLDAGNDRHGVPCIDLNNIRRWGMFVVMVVNKMVWGGFGEGIEKGMKGV